MKATNSHTDRYHAGEHLTKRKTQTHCAEYPGPQVKATEGL
jgi:hypothetical protein